MKLLVIRHAIAEEPGPGGTDAARRLTDKGRGKMRRAVKGLRRVLGKVDIIASSPLVRAVETAEIVCDAYGDVKPVIVSALEPGQPLTEVLDWVKQHATYATVAVVGHEPQLGFLITWLISGDGSRASVELRKGSACLLDFPAEIEAGYAKMLWLLKPSHLRKLGR